MDEAHNASRNHIQEVVHSMVVITDRHITRKEIDVRIYKRKRWKHLCLQVVRYWKLKGNKI